MHEAETSSLTVNGDKSQPRTKQNRLGGPTLLQPARVSPSGKQSALSRFRALENTCISDEDAFQLYKQRVGRRPRHEHVNFFLSAGSQKKSRCLQVHFFTGGDEIFDWRVSLTRKVSNLNEFFPHAALCICLSSRKSKAAQTVRALHFIFRYRSSVCAAATTMCRRTSRAPAIEREALSK